jgi:uncharacterized repeat protein (TIGR01451 family)
MKSFLSSLRKIDRTENTLSSQQNSKSIDRFSLGWLPISQEPKPWLAHHSNPSGLRTNFSMRKGWKWISNILLLGTVMATSTLTEVASAAPVTHLNTQTATATGAGNTGTPSIATFNIPTGKNRVLFIWATFERDHCSNADVTAGRCVNGNTAGTGLGDNWPEPRAGTPPASTSNNQITAQVIGSGGTIDKKNALLIGGTPSGDTRFINISTFPQGSPAGTAYFSVSSFHIVLFENDINTLLGGAASGTVSITLPDTVAPSNAGDDALLIASVYQNVEQSPTGFVRNATATAQNVAGNYGLTPTAYDAGQVPDEADDGKLVMGASSTTAGFTTPTGHVALATLTTTNAGGNFDTPSGDTTNEPNGMSGGAYFRTGGTTPASLYTLNSSGTASPAVFGGTTASFLLESDNADISDAPASYGSPTHTIVNGIRLGATVDADTSLLNSSNATGDDTNGIDDEDGVTMPSLTQGQSARISVNVNQVTAGTGRLQGWIDWNGDGDFTDAGEQIATNLQLPTGTSGTISVLVSVPSNAVTSAPTYARFRWSTTVGLTPTTTATDGEVEDYQVSITTPVTSLGTCPATAYISQGVDNSSIKLNSVDLQAGVLTPISASNFSAGVNAIGFNQVDKYIYGMKSGTDNTVMKIDANGVGYDLGAIPGLPLAIYNAGDVDANGILYVKSVGSTTAYGIDVNSASPTYLTIVKTITGFSVSALSDFAFHPTNGKLYTIQDSTGKVFEISWPTAGASVAATVVDRGKPTNLPIGIYGGVYFASDGSLYGYSNGTAGSNNGAIYRMTNVVGTGLPVATPLTTTATGISSNDGARCPLAPPVLPPGNTISGTVFNDTDSSKIQNGTEAGTNGGGLNAVLLDSSNAVVATTTVAANGTYSFSNVSPATYTVLITTGTTATITLPTNWVSTGENLNGLADTTVDSTLVNVVVSTTNVIANFGIKQSVASKPNLLLVKRITAINNNTANGNISLNSYDPETDTTNIAYPYDKNVIQSSITPPNSDKWPYTVGIPSLSSTFLLGSRNGGTIKPNDTVEYTIYFLSAGDSAAKKVLFCDRVPPNITFIPNSFNGVTADPLGLSGVDRGIAIRLGNNLTSYTNINDGDIARYYPPLSEPIADFPTINCGGSNTNGAVVVNLSDRQNATGIAVDDAAAGAFGFVRFRGEVK